jgi:calreticulin
MQKGILCLLLVGCAFATTYFKETFDDSKRWVTSSWKQSSGEAGKFALSAGEWYGGDAKAAQGFQTTQDARFYAASAKFPSSFSNKGKDLVIQFSVKFPQKIDCGGGYIKILPSTVDQENFGGDSLYNIMFGPDICGHSTKKVHVIFHYPKKGEKGENLLIKKEIKAETDQLTHVYTLIVHPDNTYEVRVDGTKRESGSLFEDWDFLPPKKIKDPAVSKPSDWVDEAMIDDPEDKKPAGWDDIPRTVPDPDAEKPEDWDEESDGEWEAPQIDNPEYKGEWKPKRIPNPAYKGPWVHPEIDNPDYKEDNNLYRYDDIGAVGIDIWQVKSGTIFDNIIVTDSVAEAEKFMEDTYGKTKDAEKAAFEEIEKKKRDEEETERKRKEEERKKAEDAAKDEDEDEDEDGPPEHDDL